MSVRSRFRTTLFLVLLVHAAPTAGQQIDPHDEAGIEAEVPCLDDCPVGGARVDVHPDEEPRTYTIGRQSSLTFTVENDGNSAATFTLDCSDSHGSITCDGLSRSSVYIAPGYSTQVTADFTASGPGAGSLRLLASGPDNADFGSYDIYVTDTHTHPLVDASVHVGENMDVSRCVLDCLDAVMSYSTPAYFSLDTPRSATLVYRSGQARPRPFVQVEVTDTSSDPADMISIQLRRRSNGLMQVLLNGTTEVYYSADASGTNRLAAQFDATGLATGAYGYDVIIRSHWAGEFRERVVPVTVLVVNEQASPFGWGWSMAGLQRVHRYSNEGSAGVLITEGDGSAAFFGGGCSFTAADCTFNSPAGDFSTLTWDASASTIFRRYPDGTLAAFHSDGRLSHVADRFGNQTGYGWSGSKLVSITDPIGKQITFGYGSDGRLDWIRSADGRYSYLTVASGNVTVITDPLGEYALRASYDGGHVVQTQQDKAGNVWTYAYDGSHRLRSVTAPSVQLDGGPATVQPVTRFESAEWRLRQSNSGSSGTSLNPRAARTAAHWRLDAITPDTVETLFNLNRWRQAVRVWEAFGTAIERVTTFSYNDDGQLTGSTGPTHHVSQTWDGPVMTGRTDHRTGGSVTWEYDPARYYGLVRTSGDAVAQHFFLNALGLPDSVKVATEAEHVDLVKASKFVYDARGRLLDSTDPDGHRV